MRILLLATLLLVPSIVAAQGTPAGRLADLTLEELANIEVFSVSRQAERLADAPGAVFIITAEDIQRSGATTLAEVLRLAPNLHVARMDAAQYAISARGFNNAVANKLLVLIDGRTIYTPLFSGVFWDQQDVLLEDVDRIEVISGPGATLWGANAVNGVINVVTRAAADTQGTFVSIGGGNREQAGAVRYGGGIGTGYFRVYGKATHLEPTNTAANTPVVDHRRWFQGGFRAEWEHEDNGFTLQGDAYSGQSADRGSVAGFRLGRVNLSGMNLLGRFSHQSDDSDFRVQLYFDRYDREEAVLFQPEASLVDVEAQYGVGIGRHRFLVGGGHRRGWDDVKDGVLVGFRPSSRSLAWTNAFVMDDIRITSELDISAGIKLERNDYTGREYLPSARLAWKPSGNQLLWGAASRAVRAPARLDREIVTPFPVGAVIGGPNFVAEVANVYELGYRGQLLNTLTGSVTAFHHQWDKVRSGTAVPVMIENRIEGPVHGLEAWATWQTTRAWRQSGGVTTFRKRLRLEPGSTDPVGVRNPQLANDPDWHWSLRSSFTFLGSHELDGTLRYVDALPNPAVPAYTAFDMRYAWQMRPTLELSVKGQNLFDDGHVEFGAAPGRSEFPRGIYLQARWWQ